MTHLAMMSASTNDRWVPDMIYTFPDGWNQTQAIARKLCAQAGGLIVHRFPDGESLVTAKTVASLAGQVVAIYQSLHNPNAKLVELLLAANAVRSLGPAKLILIAPYLSYMRQDRAFQPGQAVSQVAIGNFLASAFDAVVTIQPHLHRTHSLSTILRGVPALAIEAGRAIAARIRSDAALPSVIVGPDEESESLVRDVADMLGIKGLVAKKKRHGDTEVVIDLTKDLALEGQPAAIVDDIVSTGGTVIALAKALKRAGAGEIVVYTVHALFDRAAEIAMKDAGISGIRSLNTIPHATNAIEIIDLICTEMVEAQSNLGVSP